jgi:predicted MFS family arabinose efflux permease
LAIFKVGLSVTKSVLFISAVFFFFFLTFISILGYLPKFLISDTGSLHSIQALQYFTIAATMVIGGRFFSRINEGKTVSASLVAMCIEVILLVFVPYETARLALIFAISVQFSLALLAMFAWFWSSTESEERGRVTGFVGLATLPIYFFEDGVLLANFDFVSTALFGVLLVLGVLFVMLVVPMKTLAKQKSNVVNCYEKRTFLLYSIPWILFSLINATLALNISSIISAQVSPSLYSYFLAFQFVGVSSGVVIGGVIADLFGRRSSLMLSLTMYGTSSALLGLAQNNAVFLVAYAGNGLSWGILFMLYIFVVWGDLATEKTVGKTYSIGLAIYYSALGVGILFPSLSQIPLIAMTLASCLLIFLLNVPVILAPELLRPDFRERIRLKMHMNAVKKIERKSKN